MSFNPIPEKGMSAEEVRAMMKVHPDAKNRRNTFSFAPEILKGDLVGPMRVDTSTARKKPSSDQQ